MEGLTVAELYERLADDLWLMEDISWASEADQESVGLTMPRKKLAETLRRLRSDARRDQRLVSRAIPRIGPTGAPKRPAVVA